MDIIAGVDVGCDLNLNLAHTSIAVMNIEGLKLIEQIKTFTPVKFPYIPGLLSFREIPAILEALSKLTISPDILMVDGHGIAHPKNMGIAAHLGAILDLPTIGVGKSCLTGNFTEPGNHKGDKSILMAKNKQIGIVLRSRDNTKTPFYLSWPPP